MSSRPSTPSTGADVILINGRIATLDRPRASASAVAVKDERFVAVGSDADAMAHRSETTGVIDLRGRVVVPGLNWLYWTGRNRRRGAAPRLTRRLSLDSLTGLATIVFAVVTVLTAWWRWLPGLWAVMVIAGLAWIAMNRQRKRVGPQHR